MRLQIDTIKKSIKLEEATNFCELYKWMKEVLPIEWKLYTVETNTTIHYYSTPYITWYNTYTPITGTPYTINCAVSHSTFTSNADNGLTSETTTIEGLKGTYNITTGLAE